jgi:hypothetical protein
MAGTKTAGLGDNFYCNGYDLSGDLSSVDTISSPMAPMDVTALNQYGHHRVNGLRDGAISFTTFFDAVTTVSNPGVPASTVPYVSTYSFQVSATLTGGTYTHVFINGVESYVPVAPAVPNTQVPVRNNTGAVLNVTISGGTMSQVLVNGFQVGTGAGVYPLMPGQLIVLVYSSAPTWSWANASSTYQIPAYGTISITYSSAPTWNWFALGQEHNALAGLSGNDQVCTYARGAAIGNPGACMVSKQTDYNPTRDASANLTVKCDWMANAYGLEWGIQLTQGLRVDTAALVGPAYTDVAGTAFGAQAYLQLVELVGTNVDVSITHCTTVGGSYTTLMDFGSVTGIGAVRQATATNTTQVDQYLKVVTTGTFSYAAFSVVFVRNPIAGVGF